jgi:glycosyltransferase involved in cell wall biosynthesis
MPIRDERIAVLMPAFNAEETLPAAVASVLASTLPVHLFIVDDCSSVPVDRVVQGSACVTILRLERNMGISNALNYGLNAIMNLGFDYIARMDADDVSLPSRFEKQLAFLKANEDVALVGCWTRHFSNEGTKTLTCFTPPATHRAICNAMFFNSPISHPTWFIRSDIFVDPFSGYERYRPDYRAGSDYDFLCRLVRYRAVANIPEILLNYRVSRAMISRRYRFEQLRVRLAVQLSIFQPFNWRSYAGICKTLALFIVPNRIVLWLKHTGHGARNASATA